jgi:hypothetical protein
MPPGAESEIEGPDQTRENPYEWLGSFRVNSIRYNCYFRVGYLSARPFGAGD